MPIGRYLAFVGGALLALLFAANWYLAQTGAAFSTAPVDYSPALPLGAEMNIRIHSDRKWPEKLVFDTNAPPIAPPAASPEPIAPARESNLVTDRILQAFAQFTPASSAAHFSAPGNRRGAIKFE